MPQFKSTVFIWSLCGDNLVPVQSVDLHDECEQHACAQKGSSYGIQRGKQTRGCGDLKMCIPDQVFWQCLFSWFHSVVCSVTIIYLCVQDWKSEIVLIPYRDPFSIFQETSTRGNSSWVLKFELISAFVVLLKGVSRELLMSIEPEGQVPSSVYSMLKTS